MGPTRDFHIGDILSVTTGKLVSLRHVDGIYDLLNWMTGESVFTHQIPRISREARPVIIAFHPQLQQASDEANEVNGDNWRSWLDTWIARYGETLPIPKMTIAEHERIDAISELGEYFHPDNIIVVPTPATPEDSADGTS